LGEGGEERLIEGLREYKRSSWIPHVLRVCKYREGSRQGGGRGKFSGKGVKSREGGREY